MLFRRLPVIVALSVALLTPAMANAHPDHPDPASSVELFPGEGVGITADLQHSGSDGHLPPVQENVTLVGRAEVTNPSGDGNDGRVADVFAHGDHAYLTAFREPTCEQAGVHVMDISDPTAPFELTGAFIPTTVGSYAGEGIQVIPMDNEFFTGDLLLHQNETCPAGPPPPSIMEKGGINLWDVSDPTDPEPVKLHAGDLDGGFDGGPNQTHSMRAWTNVFDKRTYVALVDDEELTDIDILDITDPFHPVLVNDDLNLDEPPFDVDQPSPANLTASFSHDMMIEKIGQRYVMNMNYWDGGYVLLDVTDPREDHVTLIAESDYPALDEERLARGHEIAPEGNAHQSELSPNHKFLLATDEDFNPYRVVATITSGPYAGTEYTATSASDTPPIEPGTPVAGTPTFVGLGCDPLPAGTGIALVERGACTFQVKLDNIEAAGYTAGIVFNSLQPACMAGVTMLAAGDIPFVFANRLAGLQLLGVAGVTAANACTTASPPSGSAVASTTIEAVFDGWGFVRLFGTEIPNQRGEPGSITSIDTYAVPESQDEDFAIGFGDLSVHEVAMAAETGLAYISYYAAGLRVVTYGRNGIEEVGAFIDEGGNNFWGVEVWHDEHGTEYVLASDRDFGLYIFQYTP
ncbi:MAG: PA domain-containing protein [Acidimicrobiales bacterium]